jgi:hypothetical protein
MPALRQAICLAKTNPMRPSSSRFEKSCFRCPWWVSFHHNKSYCTILHSVFSCHQKTFSTRTWVTQILPKIGPLFTLRVSKVDRVAKSINILTVLHRETSNLFPRIVTDNESWFLYQYSSDHIFTVSRNEVIPRERAREKSIKLCWRFSSSV